MAAVATHPEPVSAPPPPQQENVVMPALRGDLIVTQQFFEGRSYYVVKAPISLQYFRMTAEDYFLATLFDGRRTFGVIRDLYVREFPHIRLENTPEEINERVLRFANDLALLQFLSVQGMRLKARYDAARTRAKKGGLYSLANKVFFFRFSLFDPDRMFTRMARPLWWVWTPATLWISIVLITAAVLVFVTQSHNLDKALA